MVEILEKKEPATLEGWVIVSAHGKDLIGNPIPLYDTVGRPTRELKPVYQLLTQMQQTPGQNTVQINFKVMPLYMLFSIESVNVPNDALVVLIENLDRTERTAIQNAVRECEEMLEKTRAARAVARAGIVTPGLSKIPSAEGILKRQLEARNRHNK